VSKKVAQKGHSLPQAGKLTKYEESVIGNQYVSWSVFGDRLIWLIKSASRRIESANRRIKLIEDRSRETEDRQWRDIPTKDEPPKGRASLRSTKNRLSVISMSVGRFSVIGL
jgi:hypothetical protein